MAAKASDYNRRVAYRTLTGRDYDVDSSMNLEGEVKQMYADFNDAWDEMDIKDRVLFDRDGFQKTIVEATEAAYKELKDAEKANKD